MAKQNQTVEIKHKIAVEKIRQVNGGSLQAFANITIDGLLKIYGVKIIKTKPDAEDGKELLFVALPQQKGKNDRYYPIVEIEDDDLNNAIQAQVLNAYESELKKEPQPAGI